MAQNANEAVSQIMELNNLLLEKEYCEYAIEDYRQLAERLLANLEKRERLRYRTENPDAEIKYIRTSQKYDKCMRKIGKLNTRMNLIDEKICKSGSFIDKSFWDVDTLLKLLDYFIYGQADTIEQAVKFYKSGG